MGELIDIPPRRVLLVDDEPRLLDTLNLILERRGYHVRTADGVAPALEWVASEHFDVLLTDLSMSGMARAGLTVARAMRLQQPWARVLVVSGYLGVWEEATPEDRGVVDEYLTKPIEIPDLLRALG